MTVMRTPRRLLNLDACELPDLHNEIPAYRHRISVVGHRGVRRPALIGGRPAWVSIEVGVGLCPEQRGGHMSRLITAIGQDVLVGESLFDITEQIIARLTELVPDAPSLSIDAEAELLLEVSGGVKPVHERVRYLVTGTTRSMSVGIGCQVCLACPQAQAVLAASATSQDLRHIATHNQVCTMEVELRSANFHHLRTIRLGDILELCELSASGPVREAHKRLSEAQVVADIHDNARFAEDALRCFVSAAFDRWHAITSIQARLTNFESIFEYPLFAKIEVDRSHV